MGAVDRVRDRLVATTPGCGLVVPQLFGEHATSLLEADPIALEALADGFREAGAWLFAAEASAQAARLHLDHGAAAASARAAERAQSLALRSPGVIAPALAGVDRLGLSRREGEVARLAAQGQTNRGIAGHLGLALRTVENHLARVYRKLEVSGRQELRGIIPYRGTDGHGPVISTETVSRIPSCCPP